MLLLCEISPRELEFEIPFARGSQQWGEYQETGQIPREVRAIRFIFMAP